MPRIMDLAVERPPELYEYDREPPAEAWDVQFPAPPSVVAWHATRAAAGLPAALYDLGRQRVGGVMAGELPTVPQRSRAHLDAPYLHTHVLVGFLDQDVEPVDPREVKRAADEAWLSAYERMLDYTHRHPELGVHWHPELDRVRSPDFTCTGHFGLDRPVIIAGP